MSQAKSNQRTDPKTERLVITKIAQGIRYQEIYEEVGVPVSTIKKIKKRNLELFYEVRHEIIQKDAAIAARVHNKAHILLERRIDAALAGKIEMSTIDLVRLVKEMAIQKQYEKQEAEEIKNQRISFERQKALLDALHKNDTNKVQKVLFEKNKSQPHALIS